MIRNPHSKIVFTKVTTKILTKYNGVIFDTSLARLLYSIKNGKVKSNTLITKGKLLEINLSVLLNLI